MKKRNAILSVLAASVLLLSSCDVAVATIKNPNDPAFNTNNVQVDNNTLKDLFDIIHSDENYNSEVASLLTNEVAKNYLGNYTIDENGDILLENWDYKHTTGDATTTVTDDEKIEFIKSHQAYWNWTDAGIRITYEDIDDIKLENLDSYTTRINMYKELIKKQVVVTMFNNINNDSYKYNSSFYEILYVESLMDSLYPVYSVNTESGVTELSISYVNDQINQLKENDYQVENTVSSDGEFTQGVFIDSSYDPEKNYNNIIDGDNALIHLEHYVVYINNQVIPTIVNNLLTELYIMQNQYAAIGRTQQRRIEYVQIQNNTQNNAYQLLRNFASNYLDSDSTTISEENFTFDSACTAWMGIPEDLDHEENALAKTLAQNTFGNITTDWQNTQVLVDEDGNNPNTGNPVTYIDGTAYNGYSYYRNSVYGDLIKDYSTLTDNPSTNNATNYDSFTNINDRIYSPQDGLEIRTNQIRIEDYTTYGWGTKSDYSSLPSSITDRLFSASIVNELNSANSVSNAIDWTYLKSFEPGGVTFLKKATYDRWNEYDSIIWSNDDESTYYIIAVYDYITPSKTTSDENTTAEEMREIESYALEVGYEIASSDTYTSSAIEYFLDQSYLTYFDQDVFEYFQETYPDLFD